MQEKELVIATKNEGKVREFQQMLSEKGWTVRSLLDFSVPDVVEDGKTFAENAAKKAETISKALGRLVIADDSGLVVDALDGRPGVLSARYAGVEKDDIANMEKVLAELRDVPPEKRTARFVCTIAVARPNRPTLFYEGVCEGMITRERIGNHGFGYEPIFYVPALGKTMAQLEPHEKNKWSHRAKALEALLAHEREWNDE